MRSMVEGACGKGRPQRHAPSVSAPRCHLPVPGRIVAISPHANSPWTYQRGCSVSLYRPWRKIQKRRPRTSSTR